MIDETIGRRMAPPALAKANLETTVLCCAHPAVKRAPPLSLLISHLRFVACAIRVGTDIAHASSREMAMYTPSGCGVVTTEQCDSARELFRQICKSQSKDRGEEL